MKESKLEFNSSDDAEAVFYEAFRYCDASVMAALWADGDVLCIHPGSGVISGYEAVSRSWQHIFSNGGQTDLTVTLLKKTISDELAVHLVSEEIGTGEKRVLVLATNVYQRFEQGWLMVEHHGSLVQNLLQNQTLQ